MSFKHPKERRRKHTETRCNFLNMNKVFEISHLEDDFEDKNHRQKSRLQVCLTDDILFRIRRRSLIIIPFWFFNYAFYKYFTCISVFFYFPSSKVTFVFISLIRACVANEILR